MAAFGQTTSITIVKEPGQRPSIAVPDFKGTTGSDKFMDVFNATLWNELENCGVLRLVAKSLYPLTVPQQPAYLQEQLSIMIQASQSRMLQS